MKHYITLDSLLKYSPSSLIESFPVPDTPVPQVIERKQPAGSLENILKEKVQCVSTILNQISHDIKGRKHLSQRIIYRIYQHYFYLKEKLFELYHWELGKSRSVESRRSQLERQLDSLKQEKRQEQVKCWGDVEVLKKEFRNWFKQYSDLMQRVRIVMPNKAGNLRIKNNSK